MPNRTTITHNKQRVAERRRQVAKLRLAGVRDQRTIARTLGVSLGTINADCRALDAEFRAQAAVDTGLELELQLERLEQLHASVWAKAVRGDLRAIDAALAVMRRKAKLLGLDAPERRELSGQVSVNEPAELLSDDERRRRLLKIVRDAYTRVGGDA